MSIKDLEMYDDSILIIIQSIGEWEVRNLELIKYKKMFSPGKWILSICLFQLDSTFNEPIHWCPSKLSLLNQLSEETNLHLINVGSGDELAYCHNIEAEPDGILSFYGINMILKDGSYPDSANLADKKILRKLACHFSLTCSFIQKIVWRDITKVCGCTRGEQHNERDSWRPI